MLSELVLVFRGVRSSGPVIVLQSSNSVITSASALGPFIARKSRLPPLLYIFVLCGESRGRLSNDIIHPAHNTSERSGVGPEFKMATDACVLA